MKDLFIAFMILVIIIGGDIIIQKHLEKTTNELVEILENLKEKTVEAKTTNERKEAIEETKEVDKKWDKINKIWSTVIVHQEIDNIEQAIIRAESNIHNGELDDAIPEIETAIFFVKHVNERENLKLKNIF